MMGGIGLNERTPPLHETARRRLCPSHIPDPYAIPIGMISVRIEYGPAHLKNVFGKEI